MEEMEGAWRPKAISDTLLGLVGCFVKFMYLVVDLGFYAICWYS